ncbi:MAG: DUF4234 domain-containing protein [Candidatus Saccharimonadales bacterium]
MKHRSPAAVFFLPFVTFGIYSLVWQVKTKHEMEALGAEIPTSWLLIVPIANYYWLWKYCAGVEKVTKGKQTQVLAFVLMFLLGMIGHAIIQVDFNKVAAGTIDVVPAAPTGPNAFAPVDGGEMMTPAAPAMDAPVEPMTVDTPDVVASVAPVSTDPTTGEVVTPSSSSTPPQA